MMEFNNSDVNLWKETLAAYESRIKSMNKPNLLSLHHFCCKQLPSLLQNRNPNPYITTADLSKLMQWTLTRGKWRSGLLDIVSSLDEDTVKSVSQKAFKSLPDVSKAVSELTAMKGVEPVTASAVLAAYAPDIAPFMSDEAMVAALGSAKELSLKKYIMFIDKLQAKAKELSAKGDLFTASDVERALWSCAIGVKFAAPPKNPNIDANSNKKKRKYQKIAMDGITRITWTSDRIKCFLETCIEEVKKVGRRGGSLQIASWANLGKRLEEMHGMKLTQKQLKNHFDHLKLRYKGWVYLRNKAGNLYDPKTNTFKLSNQEWNDFCKGHRKAETLRSSPLLFRDLCAALFDGTFASGSHALALSSSRVRSGVSSSTSNSHIHDDDDDDDYDNDDDEDTSAEDSESSSSSPVLNQEDPNVDKVLEILSKVGGPSAGQSEDGSRGKKKRKRSSNLNALAEAMSGALERLVASMPQSVMDACVEKLKKLDLDELDPLFCAAYCIFGHSTLLREAWLALPPNPELLKRWIGNTAKRLGFLD